MITFACPHCNKPLSVKDEFAGKTGKCPHCKRQSQVPASGGVNPRLADMERQETLAPSVDRATDTQTGATSGDSGREHYDFLAPAQAPDELGRLGSYRVLRVLGAGGMGVVFQAEDPLLKRKVALKAMLPSLAASESARKRFLREAQTAAAIEHDHIVHIYQVGEDRGIPFLAMQFLKGEALDERLKRDKRLPLNEALRIGREAALGLAAAHRNGLVHRDIKPANLWLEETEGSGASVVGGRVKILDFGLARAAAGDNANLTQSGAILGTPAYMAPEQANGKVVDGRCDLFSLGCVLYRLCTGEMPFKGTDPLSTLMAIAMHNPNPPAVLNPAIPGRVSDLIMKLLAKEPEGRPASAAEVAELLAKLQHAPKISEFRTATLKPERKRPPDEKTTVVEPELPRVPNKAKAQRQPRQPKRTGLPLWLILGGAGGVAAVVVIAVVAFFVVRATSGGNKGSVSSSDVSSGASHGSEPGREPADGFISLFNGTDLSGWEGLDGYWSVRDGVIVGHQTKENAKQTFLIYANRKFSDFEFHCQYKFATPDGNSGVQFRSKVLDPKTYVVGGYQADCDSKVGYDGSIYDERGVAGGRDTLSGCGKKVTWDPTKYEENLDKSADELKKFIKIGDWNDMVLVARGNRITYSINGQLMTDLTDNSPKALKEGVLALQLHAGIAMEVQFKNLRIRVFDEPPSSSSSPISSSGPSIATGSVWTDPNAANIPVDFKFQGDYMTPKGSIPQAGCQVIALGNGRFQAVFLPGGLPVYGWDGTSKILMDGILDGQTVQFKPAKAPKSYIDQAPGKFCATNVFPPAGHKDYSADLRNDTLEVTTEDKKTIVLKKTVREPVSNRNPPARSITLFNGTNTDAWTGGRLDKDTKLLNTDGKNIFTKQNFSSYTLHVEFMIPFCPDKRGQSRGNSGVFMVDMYEVQILDSFGLEGNANECGAVYNLIRPQVNLCYPPLTWQTYDIDFTNAVRSDDGKITKKAHIRVSHNGGQIIDAEIPGPTLGSRLAEQEGTPGPIQLQGHGNPLQFRNIWIVEKEKK